MNKVEEPVLDEVLSRAPIEEFSHKCFTYNYQKLPFTFFKQQKRKLRFSLAERMAILVVGDLLLLVASVSLTICLWTVYHNFKFSSLDFAPSFYLHLFWFVAPWLLISLISNSYSTKNLSCRPLAIKAPIRTTLLVWVVYFLVYFFATKGSLPRVAILVFGTISCFFLIAWRLCHFWIFSQERLKQRIVIVGQGDLSEKMKVLIEKNSLYYELAGIILDCRSRTSDSCSCRDCLGSLENLSVNVDRIVFAAENFLSPECLQFLIECRETGIPITPMPVFYEQLTKCTPIECIKGWYLSLLPLQDAEWSGFYPVFKRILDLSCALAGSIVFFLLLPFLALAIKLTSPGPIFFSQERVGKNGKVFRLWKFRTMIENDATGDRMWTLQDDARITSVGKILRKLHLDELPQIWNIFTGEASVVGVRPLSLEQCKKFAKEIPFHNLRHLVKPGLTSWAVISHKHVNSMEGARERLEYDIYYVKNQSILFDLLIIFRTIWTMVTLNGL